MHAIAELLRHHPELALFATLSLGYFFGQFKFGSISLGTVASTLLVGVVIGLANIKIDPFTKSCFFYLFIFAIGYKVGPQFFQGLRGEGLRQAALAVTFCVVALVTVWAISLAVGYAVTYPFGSAGMAWFLSQVAPKVLRTNLREACREKERELSGGKEDL